jgi:hypothetical protein
MKFNEQFNKYMEEADVERLAQQDPREVYDDPGLKGEAGEPGSKYDADELRRQAATADEEDREEGYKLLEQAFKKFYMYGYSGSGVADAQREATKVASMLEAMHVDERDIKRFTDALISIILGQIVSGHADS